jgi:hypothetical protein
LKQIETVSQFLGWRSSRLASPLSSISACGEGWRRVKDGICMTPRSAIICHLTLAIYLEKKIGDWRASLLAALLVANSATFLTMSDEFHGQKVHFTR